MSVIFLLIPLSVLFAAGFLAAFIWAVRAGQYEDTTTPSLRVLWDEASFRGGAVPPTPPSPSRSTPAQPQRPASRLSGQPLINHEH